MCIFNVIPVMGNSARNHFVCDRELIRNMIGCLNISKKLKEYIYRIWAYGLEIICAFLNIIFIIWASYSRGP